MRFSIAMALVAALPVVAQAALNDQLQAYYKFDNLSAADHSGHGYDLTLSGGAGFAGGLIGGSLNIAGDNARTAARPIDDDDLDFFSSNFTVQAWVNYDSTAGEQVLVEKFTGATGPGWTLTKLADNRFAIALNSGAVPVLISPVQAISIGAWHNVTARRIGTQLELFFDRQPIAQGNSTQTASTTAPLLVGRRNDTDGRDFATHGRLDEVAIWRQALTDNELDFLWNNGAGQMIPEPTALALLGVGAVALIRRRRQLTTAGRTRRRRRSVRSRR